MQLDTAMDALLEEADIRLRALAAHRALTGPQYQVELRRQRVDELLLRLEAGIDAAQTAARARWDQAHSALRGLRPQHLVRAASERLAQQAGRLVRVIGQVQMHGEERLAGLAARMEALSPLAVIARGYAVLRTPEGRVVRVLADAPPGSVIASRVGDGWIDARVEGHRRQGLNEPGDLYSST